MTLQDVITLIAPLQDAFGVYLEALGISALLSLAMIVVGALGARYITRKFINNPILVDDAEQGTKVMDKSYKGMAVVFVLVIAGSIGAAVGLIASR